MEKLEKIQNESRLISRLITKLETEIEDCKLDHKVSQYEKFNPLKHMDDFLHGKIVLNCNKSDSAIKLIKSLRGIGINCTDKTDEDEILNIYWDTYKENTCFRVSRSKWNTIDFDTIDLIYKNIETYEKQEIKIVFFR